MDWVFNYTPAGSHNDHVGAVRLTEVRHPATNFRAIAYQCRLEEDFDGAPDACGRDNDHPVDPARNPDTWMQQGVSGRDRLCNATKPFQNCDAGRHDFAYVGLFARHKILREPMGSASTDGLFSKRAREWGS
jgi:hypothetical protein